MWPIGLRVYKGEKSGSTQPLYGLCKGFGDSWPQDVVSEEFKGLRA